MRICQRMCIGNQEKNKKRKIGDRADSRHNSRHEEILQSISRDNELSIVATSFSNKIFSSFDGNRTERLSRVRWIRTSVLISLTSAEFSIYIMFTL